MRPVERGERATEGSNNVSGQSGAFLDHSFLNWFLSFVHSIVTICSTLIYLYFYKIVYQQSSVHLGN